MPILFPGNNDDLKSSDMEWKQSNKCFNIYSDINAFESAFGSRERRSVMQFYPFLDREVLNLYNEVGAVCSYVLRTLQTIQRTRTGGFLYHKCCAGLAGCVCINMCVCVISAVSRRC